VPNRLLYASEASRLADRLHPALLISALNWAVARV